MMFSEVFLIFLANRASFALPDEADDVRKPILALLVRYLVEKILIADITT